MYSKARFTSTPPQRLTSPPVTQGAFCVLTSRNALSQHRVMIELDVSVQHLFLSAPEAANDGADFFLQMLPPINEGRLVARVLPMSIRTEPIV